MSAERYEIIDQGCRVTIICPDGSVECFDPSTVGVPNLDDVAAGAIRQQARDIDQLRADLAVAVAERDRLIAELPLSTGRDVNETRERLGPITRIADGPSERAYVCATTAREVVGYVIAERDSVKLRAEQAEARLAELEKAAAERSEYWGALHSTKDELFECRANQRTLESELRITRDQRDTLRDRLAAIESESATMTVGAKWPKGL